MSAESGLPTFRDAGGLWEGERFEDVASPAAYDATPARVHRFYDQRRRQLADVEPNPAHHALAELESRLGDDFLLVTQNVDDLHERAGSERVVHMHGRLRSALCLGCGLRTEWLDDLAHRPPCPTCGRPELRPDVVWFGEVPYEMDRIFDALEEVQLFCSIGTSGAVHPAAAFVQRAAQAGARTVELNLLPSLGTAAFDEARQGPAGVLVPEWVAEVTSHLRGRR